MLDVESLNADCACITLDREALCQALETEVEDAEFCRALAQSHPTLISTSPVFISRGHVRQMAETIAAIERVAELPGYRDAALAGAPSICRYEPGAVGVFMGYDFHLGADGPRLIEINTNAGGALINAFIARAQKACCTPVDDLSSGPPSLSPLVEIFRRELRRQRGTGAVLERVAIVDDSPEKQYLYPELVLFRHLFRRHGIEALIAAPETLELRDGVLRHEDRAIDLVYNRLTDFMLSAPEHEILRAAYQAGAAVVTPNPRAHALLADKRNLIRLSGAAALRAWGVDEHTIAILSQRIPRTEAVTRDRAAELWDTRSKLFFKPAAGFGSRAAYRGDKLTRRVWEGVLDGGYVAQELVPPSARTVIVDGDRKAMKVDVRNYTYGGEVLSIAARLYQGQTTNFRTPGGGFAPVLPGSAFACPPSVL
ncbi:MAG: hypothetical protein KJZ80_01965 [Hyphomicrobiaceae bacterium]|nr:hypothetical protein [Hyphomicrobiaceae bacterium]